MLNINKYDFLKQCALAKKSFHDVINCIIDMNDDIWTVDDSHPDFPHIIASLSSSKTVILAGNTGIIDKLQEEFLANKNQ